MANLKDIEYSGVLRRKHLLQTGRQSCRGHKAFGASPCMPICKWHHCNQTLLITLLIPCREIKFCSTLCCYFKTPHKGLKYTPKTCKHACRTCMFESMISDSVMWNETFLSFSPHHLFTQVRLEWPTDLAINPMDNSIYVLDNNVVLQITENRQVFYQYLQQWVLFWDRINLLLVPQQRNLHVTIAK